MPIASARSAGTVRSGVISFTAVALLSSLGACVTPQNTHGGGVAWRASAGVAVAADLEPGHWKAVLVSGSRVNSAYDAAAHDLGQRLRARGVALVATALAGGAGDFAATYAGISQALGWLGKEHGACLFFATGHGDSAGLRLDADRGDRTLSPGGLDRLLDKHCGGRPTVAIISGCEAAVFFGAGMRQANRIVIAAAAVGRDSYGAAMSDRYVNFDRCLIDAIDAGAETWREAFQRTLPCVRAREAWLGVRASDPQAYFGAAVADLAVPGVARPTVQMR